MDTHVPKLKERIKDMQEDTILQRFRRFKSMMVSAEIPCDMLMELLESYITAEDEALPLEEVPILEGQLSLLDAA